MITKGNSEKLCDIVMLNQTKVDGNLEEISRKVLFMYLVDGLSLTQIENTLHLSNDFKGWFSKSILNFYGISTSTKDNNRAKFKHFGKDDFEVMSKESEEKSIKDILNILIKMI